MQSQNSLSTLTLVPMTRDQAALLVKRLLGSYPSLNLHDPETYITEMIALLEHYSTWVGEKAIETAKKESPKFVPSVPEVGKACEAIIGDTRRTVTWAQDWNRRAQLQLEERDQQDALPPANPELFERIRREMAAAGMPIMGDKVRGQVETPQGVQERFNITHEQWAAIPDAPLPGHWETLCKRHAR